MLLNDVEGPPRGHGTDTHLPYKSSGRESHVERSEGSCQSVWVADPLAPADLSDQIPPFQADG